MSQQTSRRGRARDAQAEAEPEPGTLPEGEPDEEDQAAEEESEQPSPEVQMRKIDNARRKYRRDLEGIVGDLGDVAECPLCDALGFVESSQAYNKREDVGKCPICDGLGLMLTGSRVPDHTALPCPKCNGVGYARPDATPSHEQPLAPVVPIAPPVTQVHGWFDPVTQTFHPYGEGANG